MGASQRKGAPLQVAVYLRTYALNATQPSIAKFEDSSKY